MKETIENSKNKRDAEEDAKRDTRTRDIFEDSEE
jgi:hypothetical protein